MVTIDCHLHLTETPSQVPEWWMTELFRPYGGVSTGSSDGAWMVDLLDRSGVDIGMLQGADLRRTTWHPDYPEEHEVFVPNDYTIAQIARFPDRLRGVVCIDPIRDIGAALEELDRCVLEHDFRALKIVASFQQYSANDRRLDPIYERCIELDIPVHIFSGWTPLLNAMLQHADPILLDDIGRRYRDLKLIVALGAPWIEQCIVMIAKHPNLHADMYYYSESGPEPLYETLSKFRSLGAIDRVLYGSNNSDKVRMASGDATVPDVYRAVNDVARYRGAEPFTDDEMADILGGSAARLYKITS